MEEEVENFFRIRGNINVDKPIRRGMRLYVPNLGEEWEILQYERLPHICFYSGHIGHMLKNCKQASKDFSKQPY